ncbi:uncharacterized protein N7498_006581 [Penicillium cinerascens]|uniref:Uncharacterized protein n=1 Tax=Penicillium cinerascens TaxID=70096 RepID=A0A9W9SXH8_9EURO|nr:uncharacterized protein N7498_006581 [Penicillium cinerascens]KAJ5201918.1 hypothetical protein N7498_006581 [Penicillium cinerascens]
MEEINSSLGPPSHTTSPLRQCQHPRWDFRGRGVKKRERKAAAKAARDAAEKAAATPATVTAASSSSEAEIVSALAHPPLFLCGAGSAAPGGNNAPGDEVSFSAPVWPPNWSAEDIENFEIWMASHAPPRSPSPDQGVKKE